MAFIKWREKKEEQEKLIEQLMEQNKNLDKRLDKLERIIWFSKDDKVTYKLRRDYERTTPDGWHMFTFRPYHGCFWSIYIYEDKREYVIRLDELGSAKINESETCFKVTDPVNGIALLSVTVSDRDDVDWIYEFTIDYRTGKYIYIRKAVERKE